MPGVREEERDARKARAGTHRCCWVKVVVVSELPYDVYECSRCGQLSGWGNR